MCPCSKSGGEPQRENEMHQNILSEFGVSFSYPCWPIALSGSARLALSLLGGALCFSFEF